MQNALIFSPSFSGHRQIYVFVLAHILHKLDFKIYVAGDFTGNLNSSFYLEKLKEETGFCQIDTSSYKGNGFLISNSEFIKLQKEYNISLTVFAEADNHIPLIVSQLLSKNHKFQGKVIGIFLRPFHFYRKLKFREKFRYYKFLSSRWKTDTRFFHEVLNRRNLLLDKTLHIDDFFASKHKNTICLPDVFQQYADYIVKEEHSDQRIWIKRLDEFKNKNNGSLFIFYFGTAQQRRGYDQLLKLAVDQNICFIHCGLRRDAETYSYDVDEFRNTLQHNGKLFETNEYITDPLCIEHFFTSVTHLILPYVDFYGSSGVMLQALGYKIPVLVPDIGIMGYRVKKYNLGQTYSHSLADEFLLFIKKPAIEFSASIEKYMEFQSSERLESVLLQAFTEQNEKS